MALAIASSIEAVRTLTTDPFTFGTGTGTTGDRGVVVAMAHGTDNADYISSITVDGGKALTRIVRAAQIGGEPGAAELWLWTDTTPLSTNSSVTISCDLTSATTVDMQFFGWRIDCDSMLEVVDFGLQETIQANPTVTMAKGGRDGLCFGSFYGGANAPAGTLATGLTQVTEDLGNFWASAMYEATSDTSDQIVGYTTLGSDDVALAAMCVAEIVPVDPRGAYAAAKVYDPALAMAVQRMR